MKLVFHIREYFSGNAEIYFKNIDGNRFTKLTNISESDFNSSWQPIVSAGTFADFDGAPVPAVYDGDGKTDLAVFRGGTWYLQQSSQGFAATQLGLAVDVPVPADYDGDGRADAAVFCNGIWYLRQSTNGFSIRHFGLTNNKPIPAAFLP